MDINQPHSKLIGKEVLLIRMGGELGIKSRRTRRRMINLLRTNIDVLLKEKKLLFSIIDFRGRLLIVFTPPVIPELVISHIAQRVSGISSLSQVFVSKSNEDDILTNGLQKAIEFFPPHSSFAVRVRREGTHPYSSMEIAAKLGQLILDSEIADLRVDLTTPQVEILLDIRGDLAFLYSKTVYGIDGIPSTSQGTAVALIRPNANSVLSAWLMKKRGVHILPVFFRTGKTSEEEFIEYVESHISPVHSFIDLGKFLEASKDEEDLCFFCQVVCETICQKYVSEGSVQAFISPTCFNHNGESINLEALSALESYSEIVGLRPIQFGFHGKEPLVELLDNKTCCHHRKKLEINLPQQFGKNNIEKLIKEM